MWDCTEMYPLHEHIHKDLTMKWDIWKIINNIETANYYITDHIVSNMSKQILYQIQSPLHLSTKTGKRPTVIVPKMCKSSFMITIKTEFNYCFYTQDIYIPKSHNTAFRIDIIQDFKISTSRQKKKLNFQIFLVDLFYNALGFLN